MAKAKIIAVTNQKGGVGKTTTSVNLASALGHLDRKVLLVDLDPQGNSTSALGIDKTNVQKSVYDVMMPNHCDIKEALIETKFKNLIVMPASIDLAGVDIQLASIEKGRERMLKNQLDTVRDFFDYIIIDCPPSLSVLNTNALTAADSVIIPVQSEFFALEGLTQLLMTIRQVQKGFNPHLKIEGVLLTMMDTRNNLSVEVAIEVRKYFKDKVYDSVINRNVKLSEAPGNGMPICEYAPTSSGCQNYKSLAKEVDEQNAGKKK